MLPGPGQSGSPLGGGDGKLSYASVSARGERGFGSFAKASAARVPWLLAAAESSASSADSAHGRGTLGDGYDEAVSFLIAVLVLAVVVTLMYMRGLLTFGNLLSVYRRIRLALLLAVVAILIIGFLRILGIGDGF